MVAAREVAHRVFAEEYNASRHTIAGQGEKDPSFLVTPTGAKVNRLHVVGVCTDVEPVGEAGDVLRARISDPTGVFTVYAGQYQPEAAQALQSLQPPCFVAVTGKARTYEPEPGSLFVSIRPESVAEVDQATRDQWLLDTARRTAERLAAVAKVRGAPEATRENLVAAGVAAPVAEGVLLARDAYGLDDAPRYWKAVQEGLRGLLPGESVPVRSVQPGKAGGAGGAFAPTPQAPQWTPAAAAPSTDDAKDAFDEDVLKIVQRLDAGSGARWDDILEEAQSSLGAGAPVSAEEVEEGLNRLMDKGLVYEPTLGVLRAT